MDEGGLGRDEKRQTSDSFWTAGSLFFSGIKKCVLCDVRHARRNSSETSACEDKQTANSFGVFEDTSNLSIKLLRGSRRGILSPYSGVFGRALLFRSLQMSLFSLSKRKTFMFKMVQCYRTT